MSKDYIDKYELTFNGQTIIQKFEEDAVNYNLDFNGHYLVEVFYCENNFEETGNAMNGYGEGISIMLNDIKRKKIG